jgi:Ca-activated chloride channel family protein
VVDTLPDGYPTGLRVYGAGKTHGCDDTSLVEPVQPLDRAAMKSAVAAVEPKGDTPIGLSLRKAAGDLPESGRGTVLLVSDGEDNCGDPAPCEVAKQLADSAGQGVGLRIDELLPGQTRFYKVRVGWGQQLGYTAEFANEPVLKGTSSVDWSFVRTEAYAPQRLPVRDASGSSEQQTYFGKPLSVGLGTVAVTWTNRWVSSGAAPAVHSAGDYYIAVSLGPGAARLAENAAVGVVLRVGVTGTELAGPQYKAASGSGVGRGGSSPSAVGDSVKTGDTAVGDGGGSVTGSDLIAAGTGGMVALAGLAVMAAVRRRTRGGGA